MYCTQTEAVHSGLPACAVLAPEVFHLGLRHAGPHLWHQCGHYAPTTRYAVTVVVHLCCRTRAIQNSLRLCHA